MFLKHTYECLPYFSPDFKTSPELQDLFEFLKKLFPNQVSLLHGKTNIDEKENILNNFYNC